MRPDRSKFRTPAVIFWCAFALRVLVIVIGHTYKIRVDGDHFNFGFEGGRIARSLVTGHGYANPFNGPSGPTAWLPPLYPLLLALSFKLFGIYTNAAAIFVLVCNSFFSALIAPSIYEIAARCFDAYGIARRKSAQAAPVAMWAAWLWAVYPAALQYAIHWIWEMSLSTCLFTWAIVVALRLRRVGEEVPESSKNDVGLWALLGLLWGLVALSNASLLLVFPASLVWVLWSRGPGLKPNSEAGLSSGLKPAATPQTLPLRLESIAGAVLACVVFVVVLSPWVVRNERTMHAFIPTRDNLGIELWQSSLFYHDVYPWGQAVPLYTGDPEYKLYATMGEVKYAAMRGVQAKANLRAQPGTFLKLTATRIQYFWFGVPHPTEKHPSQEVVRQLNFGFLSLAGLMGLGLALKRRVPGAWLMASAFMLVPAAYYVVTVQARFRHPLEPLIAILAVYLFRSTTPRKHEISAH